MFAHERVFVQSSDQSDPTFCFRRHHFKPYATSLYHHHHSIVQSILVPITIKISWHHSWTTMLQRVGLGLCLSLPTMVVAALESSRGQKGYNCKRIWPHGQAWSNCSYECVVITSTIRTLWLGQYVLGSKNCPIIKCQMP